MFLLTFPTIDSLSEDDAAEAVTVVAAAEGVDRASDAVDRLFELSHGYPYFIQEFGRQAWNAAEDNSGLIARDDVERSARVAINDLDTGFLQVRTGKTTDQERAYLRTMAELGSGIVLSADVAKLMHKKTTQVGPVRDSLLKKALCYLPRHNELAFTVPIFDEFMKRWMPEAPA